MYVLYINIDHVVYLSPSNCQNSKYHYVYDNLLCLKLCLLFSAAIALNI